MLRPFVFGKGKIGVGGQPGFGLGGKGIGAGLMGTAGGFGTPGPGPIGTAGGLGSNAKDVAAIKVLSTPSTLRMFTAKKFLFCEAFIFDYTPLKTFSHPGR